MQSLIACCRLVSLADTPLAKAGLNGSLLDLDIMTAFEGAADRVATDAMVVQSNDFIPVGLQIDLLARHSVEKEKEKREERREKKRVGVSSC